MTQTPDIRIFKPSQKRKHFSPRQLEILKNGTLKLLWETGVQMPHEKALSIFADHGAAIDFKSHRVRIPPEVVEKAVSTAPRSFILAGREKRFDLKLGEDASFHIPSSCGVHFIDLNTREKRYSRKADLAEIARVFDALPLINIVRQIVAAKDYGLTSALHECHAMMTNTLKHIRGGTSMHPKLAPYLIEMVHAVCGSADAYRQRPLVNANICTLSPLSHDTHSIDCALTYGAAGMPVSFMAMPVIGTTAPVSPMAALIIGEAEILSAITLMQLAYPGTPVIHSNLVGMMDPVTARCILDVSLPVGSAAVQMAQEVWQVPSLGGVMGGMNPRSVGWESGMVDGQASIVMYLDGADLPGFTCLLDDAMTVYPEHIILVHETLERAFELLHPLDFDEDDLVLALIDKIGPRGHFLMEDHTAENFRKLRHTKILRQPDPDGGEKDPVAVALETYKDLAQNHHPEPLPEEVQNELLAILERAEKTAATLT